MIMPDGSKRGTFRSYTFLVYADNLKAFMVAMENIMISTIIIAAILFIFLSSCVFFLSYHVYGTKG